MNGLTTCQLAQWQNMGQIVKGCKLLWLIRLHLNGEVLDSGSVVTATVQYGRNLASRW